MKTVYASPSLFVSPFSPLNWTESCRLHGLPFEAQMWRTTRVNCHPTSEAMSRTLFKHTRCHNKQLRLCYNVSLHSWIMTVLDVHPFSTTPCEGIVESSRLFSDERTSPPEWRSETCCTCIWNLELHSKQLDSLRVSPVSSKKGEERGGGDRRRCKVVFCCFFFCCFFGIYWRGLSLSAECLSQPHAT